jgi:hypothetical protein
MNVGQPDHKPGFFADFSSGTTLVLSFIHRKFSNQPRGSISPQRDLKAL